MAAVEHPPLDVVRSVVHAIQRRGGEVALGGSGLLAALHLVGSVHDWDVTTDASLPLVTGALSELPWASTRMPVGDGAFATRARFVVDGGDHKVDVIVGFAVRHEGAETHLPTRITGEWQGLPLGDPVSWSAAYRAIGREEVADLLDAWIEGHA